MESAQAGDYADKGPLIQGICWAGACLATCFVAARFFTRISLIKNLGLDDWVMLLALVSTAADFVLLASY